MRDFRACIEQFDAEKEEPEVQPNLPPKAGCFLWAAAFRQRGENLFQRLNGLLEQSAMPQNDPQFTALRVLFESLEKLLDWQSSRYKWLTRQRNRIRKNRRDVSESFVFAKPSQIESTGFEFETSCNNMWG